MVRYIQLSKDISDGELYNKLKSGYVLANVEKKDGSSSLRLMTGISDTLGGVINSRVSNEDKGKARKPHWTDGLSEEEKKDIYVRNEKPMFLEDIIRVGNKGVSIYLNKVLRGEKIGDLPNLLYFEKSDLEGDENYQNLLEQRIDILNFLEGKNELREVVDEDKVKRLMGMLDEGVYFATFRKKSGEPRMMIMTRNSDVIETLTPGGSSIFEIDENDEKGKEQLLKIYDSGVIPVYDIEKQDKRVFNLNNSIKIDGYPQLKKLDARQSIAFAASEITLKELLSGSKLKRKIEATGKDGSELEAHIINLVNTNVPLDEVWTYRLNKLYVAINENLRRELGAVNSRVANSLKVDRFKNGKVLKITLGDIELYVSPKGVYDKGTSSYQYKTNPGINEKGQDAGKGGIKNQQERYVMNKDALGEMKAMLLYYVLETFKKRVKLPDLVFMNDAFMPKATENRQSRRPNGNIAGIEPGIKGIKNRRK